MRHPEENMDPEEPEMESCSSAYGNNNAGTAGGKGGKGGCCVTYSCVAGAVTCALLASVLDNLPIPPPVHKSG